MVMELFCAVDVMEGQAVRLVRGEFDAATAFGDPLGLAKRFLDAGARWLHVVDLDAARTGEARNRDVVLSIATAAHRAGACVEAGGGVRDGETVDALVAAGVDRVVLGTVALEDPDLVVRLATRYPDRVAVGMDYRRAQNGALEPALRGWTRGAQVDLDAMLDVWARGPVAALVVTAIDRDGTRAGPDTDGLSRMLDATALDVVASGGVGGAADLVSLARLTSPRNGRNVAGAVVGRALVDGSLGVEEAIAACAASA